MDVAPLRAAHELRRRRLDLVDDLDGQRQRGRPRFRERSKARADPLCVEEIRSLEQPVAATLQALEGEAGALGLLEHLRNPRARQAHLGRKILARVELSVGKLAQQREPERSEHL